MNEQRLVELTERVGALEEWTEEQRTLRDWFAGQALVGWLADGATPNPEDAAGRAYGYADAMLAARASPVLAASDTAARLLLGEVLAMLDGRNGLTPEGREGLVERIRAVLR